jgi:hypothetical protein
VRVVHVAKFESNLQQGRGKGFEGALDKNPERESGSRA